MCFIQILDFIKTKMQIKTWYQNTIIKKSTLCIIELYEFILSCIQKYNNKYNIIIRELGTKN